MGSEISAKVARRGRYVTFQLAEVAVPKELFRKILSLIDDLPPALLVRLFAYTKER